VYINFKKINNPKKHQHRGISKSTQTESHEKKNFLKNRKEKENPRISKILTNTNLDHEYIELK